MMKTHIFISVLLAGSMLASPALSQQRKSLFQVLFSNSHKQKLKRQKRAAEARKQAKQKQAVVRKLPKVKTSRNYAYKVPKRALISLAPIPVVVAVANIGTENDSGENRQFATPKISTLTRDITLAGDLRLSTEKHLAAAISEHYKTNQTYIWLNDEGGWNAKARSVAKILESADDYGLVADDYKIDLPAFEIEETDKAKASIRIRREIAMTNAVLRYAMDASYGTINPNLLSGYHDFPVHDAKAADMLERIVLQRLPANVLRRVHPSNEKFEALKLELASIEEPIDDVIELKRVFVRPGQSNAEIPNIISAIQKRGSKELLVKHTETLISYDGGEKYEQGLVAFVRDYQKEAGLGPDGVIGKRTIAKLAGVSSDSKTDKVRLAMERLRWLPHQFGEKHVFINQPEYRARYIESGAEKLAMRVVVGKKSNQTNFFYDEIEHIEYNPYWNVPRSIIVNEFLPKSLANPGYLDQRGYEVHNWNGKSRSSRSVNWYEVGANPKFAVRQPPGPKNALGELKIMFPNKHAIYMHDTPSKSLFNKQKRAFSHGCIRLHDPRAMAAAVMGTTKAQIGKRIAPGKNASEKLPSKVPVYVSYFTAWPQEDGTVKYFGDMYGRDAHLLKAMNATRKARSISISS